MGKWGGIIAQGLLGGAMTGFGALAQSGLDAQKAAAEKERDLRLAELQGQRDERLHAQNKELKTSEFEFTAEQNRQTREFQGQQQTERLESEERRHTETTDIQREQLDISRMSQEEQARHNKALENLQKAQLGQASVELKENGDGNIMSIDKKTGKAILITDANGKPMSTQTLGGRALKLADAELKGIEVERQKVMSNTMATDADKQSALAALDQRERQAKGLAAKAAVGTVTDKDLEAWAGGGKANLNPEAARADLMAKIGPNPSPERIAKFNEAAKRLGFAPYSPPATSGKPEIPVFGSTPPAGGIADAGVMGPPEPPKPGSPEYGRSVGAYGATKAPNMQVQHKNRTYDPNTGTYPRGR